MLKLKCIYTQRPVYRCSFIRCKGRWNAVMRIYSRDHHLVVKMRSGVSSYTKKKSSRIFYRCGKLASYRPWSSMNICYGSRIPGFICVSPVFVLTAAETLCFVLFCTSVLQCGQIFFKEVLCLVDIYKQHVTLFPVVWTNWRQ